jgi:hypothetical protein
MPSKISVMPKALLLGSLKVDVSSDRSISLVWTLSLMVLRFYVSVSVCRRNSTIEKSYLARIDSALLPCTLLARHFRQLTDGLVGILVKSWWEIKAFRNAEIFIATTTKKQTSIPYKQASGLSGKVQPTPCHLYGIL